MRAAAASYLKLRIFIYKYTLSCKFSSFICSIMLYIGFSALLLAGTNNYK